MKRLLLVSALLLLLGVAALAGFGSWVVTTPAGTRWLLQTASDVAGVSVTTGRLEGSLTGELLIEDLLVSWADGQVAADKLHYDVVSFGLFPARVILEFCEIERPVLRLSEKEEDEAAAADEPLGIGVLPGWLDAEIRSLKISDFVYQELATPEEEAVIADLITGHYHLADGELKAEGFAYHSPYVNLDGDFAWLLDRPHLVMDARVHLPETCVDPELFETIKVPVSFSGHLEVDGDWSHYVGPARFGKENATGETVWLNGHLEGSWRGIRITDLEGGYLHGKLAGDLDLSWIDSYRMHGTVSAEQLNPAGLVNDLEGRTTFDASGELFVPYNDSPMESRLDAVIHESYLRGHLLQGRAAGEWLGTSPVSLALDLTGEGSRLLAQGVVAERVEVDIDLPDLAPFFPDLEGALMAQGWLRWNGELLAGEMAGSAADLVWGERAVETVQFSGRHLAAGAPILVEVEGENWHYQEWQLDHAEARLSGDAENHQLQLSADGTLGHAEVQLSGRQQDDRWSGTLERLVADDMPWGSWSMSRPTQLDWEEGALSVTDLKLAGAEGAQIDLTVEQLGSEKESRGHLAWADFELDWLAENFERQQLSGKTTGEFRYEMSEAQIREVTGTISASGRLENEMYTFASEDVLAELSWGLEGLLLTGEVESAAGETLTVRISSNQPPGLSWPPVDLVADLEWHEVEIARLNGFLEKGSLEGQSDGDLYLEMADHEPVRASMHTTIDGSMLLDDRELGPKSFLLDLHWDDRRLQAAARIESEQGGSASLRLASQGGTALPWPETGSIEMEVDRLNLAMLAPWLPPEVDLSGFFNGNAQGGWTDRDQFSLAGSLRLIESRFLWTTEEGQVRVPVRDATANWKWQDETFAGSWQMRLAEHGHLQGEWQLPVAARFPLRPTPEQPLLVTLDGQVEALGVLSAISPWLVQDMHGSLETRLKLGGSWANPVLNGTLSVLDTGAYLPVSGIQLEGINIQASVSQNRIHFDRISMRSGPGQLTGYGELSLEQWPPEHYELTLSGENFQLMDFPEVQLLCDPDLTLTGTAQRILLRGTVHVPVLQIRGSRTTPEVLPSNDVVLVSVEESREDLPIETDVRVVVSLGEEVTVKTAGVDTQLAGGATVTTNPKGELLAWGEVKLVSGTYNAYGARLAVQQGLLRYQGDPVTNPRLRIFAAREVGQVLAGVQVTGRAEAPVVTLYSRPAMPERDIFSYILMGRAVRADRQDADVLMMSAGALFSPSEDRLANLGVTEIDIQGLFDGGGGLRLRKRLSEKWELESTLGIESALDLYYIIEFE